MDVLSTFIVIMIILITVMLISLIAYIIKLKRLLRHVSTQMSRTSSSNLIPSSVAGKSASYVDVNSPSIAKPSKVSFATRPRGNSNPLERVKSSSVEEYRSSTTENSKRNSPQPQTQPQQQQQSYPQQPKKTLSKQSKNLDIIDENEISIPTSLLRPRLSINGALKRLSTVRDMSAAAGRTTTFTREGTIIDNRKVFALPAFLQVQTLDDIMLTELIAKGGSGAIWKGEIQSNELLEKNLNKKYCAVKVIIHECKNDQEFNELLTSFRQEVTIIYTLAPHPNIIRLIGYAETATNDMILIEELADLNLADVIHMPATHSLTIEDSFVIAAGIIDGISWMHKHGAVHNDIKPQNIVINLKTSENFVDPKQAYIAEDDTTGTSFSSSSVSTSYGASQLPAFIRIFENVPSAKYVPKICDMGLTSIEAATTPPLVASAAGILPSERRRKSILEMAQQFGLYSPPPAMPGINSSQELSENVAPVHGYKQSNMRGFSIRYASPEQVMATLRPGNDIHGRNSGNSGSVRAKPYATKSKTDIWAWGVIVWEMLERRYPYEALTNEQMQEIIMNGGSLDPLMFKEEESLKPSKTSTGGSATSKKGASATLKKLLQSFLIEKTRACLNIDANLRPSGDLLLQDFNNMISAEGTSSNTRDTVSSYSTLLHLYK